MNWYEVTVGSERFRVEAGSIVQASRSGRDAWRDGHRARNLDNTFREREPKTVVVKLIGRNEPGLPNT